MSSMESTMYQYATKISPIYAPSSVYHNMDVKPVVDCYNVFSQTTIIAHRVTVGKFIGLPSAVLAWYGKQYGKQGREIVRKSRQILSTGPVKGKFGDQITIKDGFRALLLSGCWYTVKQIGFGPLITFPFGCAFLANDMSESDMKSAMTAAIDWLPIKPGIEVRTIEVKK